MFILDGYLLQIFYDLHNYVSVFIQCVAIKTEPFPIQINYNVLYSNLTALRTQGLVLIRQNCVKEVVSCVLIYFLIHLTREGCQLLQ